MLFSATLPVELESLASGLLQDPVRIEAELLNSLVNDIEERLYLVNRSSKVPALIALLEAGEWPQVLVFISARDDADGVAKKLARAGMTVAARTETRIRPRGSRRWRISRRAGCGCWWPRI
jgi:superfamily II DNA/RNA helicase